MRARHLLPALALTLALALPVRAAFAEDYRVIVNGASPVTALSRAEVSQLFLKKTTQWPGGQPVQPVEPADRKLREHFAEGIHKKSLSAVRSYWNQLIFSGREVPPVEKQGDAEVVAFVRATPGAVGYVSPGADLAGVKVLTVKE
jgi:ABC-type phosphate transport system substrate-binding protein